MKKSVFDKTKHVILAVGQWYKKKLIKKLLFTAAIILTTFFIVWAIPVLQIRKSPLIAEEVSSLSKTEGEIPMGTGEILVAETEGKQLYYDSESMNLTVKDKKTRTEWNALATDASESADLSLISVSYLGEDNNLYEWDSYKYCTEVKSYTSYKIKNGVQIQMHLCEGESSRFYEYMPQKMPIERFEEFFIKGLEDKKAEGSLEEEVFEKYKQTLNLIYRKSVTEQCYVVAYVGTPPASAVAQLIQITKLLGYSKEMLETDASTFGLTVTYTEPASFYVTLEATLEGEDFVIRIPTTEMVSENDFYTIQNVKVLPNFGAVSAIQCEEGYLFVPDGAGAFIDFNSYDAAVADYVRPVYNNDYYQDYFFKPEYGEELMMPVFGATYGKDENAKSGFLAIIEKGAETSYIHTKIASSGEEAGSAFNKVFASFDATQYDKFKVYGPYSSESATYLVDTDLFPVDYRVRYKLFENKVTYYDMAKKYQEYLLSNHPELTLKYTGEAKVYLEVIGAVTLTKRFVGIPYDSFYSMTTYKELKEIITDLSDKNLIITYSGAFNEGMNNTIMKKADLVAANGSKTDLNALLKMAEQGNLKLYMNAPISTVYSNGDGFYSKFHAIRNYSNYIAEIYRYINSLGIFEGMLSDDFNSYYLLSPSYLKSVANSFLKDSKKYKSLYIPDLANYCYSDYRDGDMVDAYAAANTVDEVFQDLTSEKELALYNPKMTYIHYGSMAVDISRESSSYATFATTIPFRQLVLNGLVEYTTTNVNMSSKDANYYLLQALELGSYPKFTLTAKNVDILKNTGYSYLYSMEYSLWKDTIDEIYSKYEEAMKTIQTNEITNHTILAKNVYCTEYKTQVKVITNYNLADVTVDGVTIGALSYQIVKP